MKFSEETAEAFAREVREGPLDDAKVTIINGAGYDDRVVLVETDYFDAGNRVAQYGFADEEDVEVFRVSVEAIFGSWGDSEAVRS